MSDEHTRNLPVRRLVADLQAVLYGPGKDQKNQSSLAWADNAPPYKKRGVALARQCEPFGLVWSLEELEAIRERKCSLLMMKDEAPQFPWLWARLEAEEQACRSRVNWHLTCPTLRRFAGEGGE